MDTAERWERLYAMPFSRIYLLLVAKAEKKGRTRDEVDAVIRWLTGYDEQGLRLQLERSVDQRTFYGQAPRINPNADKITGVVCSVRVEEIADPLMKQMRWLDKLVDELAKGKPLDKVLRS